MTTLVFDDIDDDSGAAVYVCSNCQQRYGFLDKSEDFEVPECPGCYRTSEVAQLKQRIHEAQMAGIVLLRGLLKHQFDQSRDYEPTEHDLELWKLIDEVDVPNDSPTGIIAVIGDEDA